VSKSSKAKKLLAIRPSPYPSAVAYTRRRILMTQTEPNVEQKQGFQEDLQVMGEQLLTRVKELVHEGNVRRIIIKQDGKSIVEFPLNVGVVGVLLAPSLAAIGAIGALIAQCSIEIVRVESPAEAMKSSVEEVTPDETSAP
jgi:hypothetical protein